MSGNIAIKVENLSKCYPIFDAPRDRLKQMFLSRIWRMVGLSPRQYYHEFWALRNVSFEVCRGETVGILGLNGSGKSTLLQTICGTLNASEGMLAVHGRTSALLELGSGFNPEFTGLENVFLNASLLGLSRSEIEERLGDILRFADIGEFIDQPIKSYSSGMVMRLAFSVAIHVKPEILIVDEALAVGDFAFQQKCYKRIEELQKKGCTILLASHDLSSVTQFCSSALVMERGQVAFQGKAGDAVNYFKKSQTSSSHNTTQLLSLCDIPQLKTHFSVSANLKEYGSYLARISDWGVLDEKDEPSLSLCSEEPSTIVIRLAFTGYCAEPIVGYFLTDRQGREVVGTNTLYLGCPVGPRNAGDQLEVRFKQSLLLAPGEYALNLGCSEYRKGELVAHHRLYDLCVANIIRKKPNVGFYAPHTEVTVNEL